MKIGDNDVVGGTFDEHGAIEVIKTWEELGVGAIYHAGDSNAGILPTIEYSTTIKPLNPNIQISQNGPEIFLGQVYKLLFLGENRKLAYNGIEGDFESDMDSKSLLKTHFGLI